MLTFTKKNILRVCLFVSDEKFSTKLGSKSCCPKAGFDDRIRALTDRFPARSGETDWLPNGCGGRDGLLEVENIFKPGASHVKLF
jgi:hypothetical protein